MKRSSTEGKVFHSLIYAGLAVLAFTMIYPFWNSLVLSFNDGMDTSLGGVTFLPRKFTFENYVFVLQDPRIGRAFFITVARTLVGTVLTISFTSVFAYAMSKKKLQYRNAYMIFCVITMYFQGGLIPRYLLIRSLGLFNTFWVMVVPGIVNVWNMIIFRSFFSAMPASLEESAEMDGAGYYTRFFTLTVPLSAPVFATLTLFAAVAQWNAWFDAALYIRDGSLMPIQPLLRQIINSNALSQLIAELGGQAAEELEKSMITTKALTMSTMMIATVPIVMVYPFLQRYFMKGIMIGSIKG